MINTSSMSYLWKIWLASFLSIGQVSNNLIFIKNSQNYEYLEENYRLGKMNIVGKVVYDKENISEYLGGK